MAAQSAAAETRRLEHVRLERTFNWARVLGAVLVVLLGPIFPSIGTPFVVVLAAALLAQAAAVWIVLRWSPTAANYEAFSWAAFGLDLAILSYAMLVFSTDPDWTTYMAGTLIVIAGGFRFGGPGALLAATVMSAAYLGVTLFRQSEFGYAFAPPRAAFHVVIYLMAGFLVSGVLRELSRLRTRHEELVGEVSRALALHEADRLKREFLAAMSHDFRTPLTVVRGNLELLLDQDRGALTPAQRSLAETAARNVGRLEEFTDELLEVVRLEDGTVALEPEEVDPSTLLADVVADHATLAEQRSQRILIEARGDLPHVVVDRSRMRRALGNVLTNAIKFAPTGSSITLRACRDGGALRIEVHDEGPGVPREERDRIFEKFFRGHAAASTAGSGLGLAITRSLVSLHGGTVGYEDTQGPGATFVVALPLAPA